MSDYLNSRDSGKKFTNKEFYNIPRNSDGDIIDLYDAYAFIGNEQREKLSDDDWSRMQEYDEELSYFMVDTLAELG
jgi:hypothetical protein